MNFILLLLQEIRISLHYGVVFDKVKKLVVNQIEPR